MRSDINGTARRARPARISPATSKSPADRDQQRQASRDRPRAGRWPPSAKPAGIRSAPARSSIARPTRRADALLGFVRAASAAGNASTTSARIDAVRVREAEDRVRSGCRRDRRPSLKPWAASSASPNSAHAASDVQPNARGSGGPRRSLADLQLLIVPRSRRSATGCGRRRRERAEPSARRTRVDRRRPRRGRRPRGRSRRARPAPGAARGRDQSAQAPPRDVADRRIASLGHAPEQRPEATRALVAAERRRAAQRIGGDRARRPDRP